jgi:menaquinone-dependent protoporphyrinogen oxidase
MNSVIIYSSKYGCTADCARVLKSRLSSDTSLVDIDKTKDGIILEKYDTVILGSSIYVGKVSKKIIILCNDNTELLCSKNLGIFLCCGFSNEFKAYLSANFQPKLIKSAKAVEAFGGEAKIDKMSFIDRTIMKTVAKGKYEKFSISTENIADFASKMNNC